MCTFIDLHRGGKKVLVNMDLVKEVRENKEGCSLFYDYDATADYLKESTVDESLRSVSAKLNFAKKKTKGFITVFDVWKHERTIAIDNIAGMHGIAENINGKEIKQTRIYLKTSLDYLNGDEYVDTVFSTSEILTKIANAQ